MSTTTTGSFDFSMGPNDDGSAQCAFVADVIVRQTDGSKTKDPFCRSGNPPQFPNPVTSENVPKLQARFATYRTTLQALGYVSPFWSTTRALTPAEVADFRALTLQCLSDMIGLANEVG